MFERLADAELVGVGAALGGSADQVVAVSSIAIFDEVERPDVVLVPGGLGCAAWLPRSSHSADWLRTVAPRCSGWQRVRPGTVIVAAAGLARRSCAATHWLAGDLLEHYGSAASAERIVEIGNVITCEGEITAMHVALLVALRLAGPVEVAQVRAELTIVRPSGCDGVAPADGGDAGRNAHPRTADPHATPELVAPDVIEFGPARHPPSHNVDLPPPEPTTFVRSSGWDGSSEVARKRRSGPPADAEGGGRGA